MQQENYYVVLDSAHNLQAIKDALFAAASSVVGRRKQHKSNVQQ